MRFKINWDGLGITASLACAVHCALLPLFVTSLPLFGINIIENACFEIVMIVLAAAIGFYSLIHGFRLHHRKFLPLLFFSVGILLLCAKQVWHHQQLWLLPPAVFCIVYAHYLNYKWCRIAPSCSVR